MLERMAEFAWLLMPLAVAAAASFVTGYLMHARAEVESARQRQALVEARALLGAAQRILEDRVEAAQTAARREALDEFLADVRVEERRFPRERYPSVIVLERVCFRGIPLTPWFEHEVSGNQAAPVRASVIEVVDARRKGQRLLV